jgi:nucleoside-diphosphate-sugar epimerase
MDMNFDGDYADSRVFSVAGSISNPEVRAQGYAQCVDAVFHLASVPGGAAEKNYELGKSVNLDATIGLIEDLRNQANIPRFVFASTIAVYGDELPPNVDEKLLPAPALSYGAHKLIGEILVADASRREWIHGCSLRLPGVVARPGDGAGMMSAFMSQLFWRLSVGQPITLPVTPDGVAWWISVSTCVKNLIHAASLDPLLLKGPRAYQMPVLRLTVNEVVQALERALGRECSHLVNYERNDFIQQHFASYPKLHTSQAESIGFINDGNADNLIHNSMAK